MFFINSRLKNKSININGFVIPPSPSFTRIRINEEDRLSFVSMIQRISVKKGITRKKGNFFHVNYWYDGPAGHIGQRLLELLEEGLCKDSVIIVSRLHIGDWRYNEPIMKRIIEQSFVHKNRIVLLETINKSWDEEEIQKSKCNL